MSGQEEQSRTYQLRGSLPVWLAVDVHPDGTATVHGLDFAHDFELDPMPGLSFERDENGGGDGRDLTEAEGERIAEKIDDATWSLSKIEDGDGAVYLSE